MSLLSLLSFLDAQAVEEVFTVIALPDTQFYSRYRSESGSYAGRENPYLTQTRWIVEQTEARNIVFTTHLGDVVDQATVNEEWVLADEAMNLLDVAGLNYGVARGNHDVTPQGSANSSPSPFADWYGPERFEGMASYRSSDAEGVLSYHQFQGGGYTFGVLFTDWRNDNAALDWSRAILEANVVPTILISHQIISPNGSVAEDTGHGILLWDELINDYDQIFLTMNGHHHGTAWRLKENSYGSEVLQMVVDYQFSPYNGAGYLRQLLFDPSSNSIAISTFSPWIEEAEVDGVVFPPLLNLEQEVTTPAAKFTWEVDFEERFGSIAGTTTPLKISVLEIAKSEIKFEATGTASGMTYRITSSDSLEEEFKDTGITFDSLGASEITVPLNEAPDILFFRAEQILEVSAE